MQFRSIPVSVAALALLTVACEDETQPTEQDYDEVASGLASLVSDGSGGGEVGSMEDAVALAYGEVPFGFSLSGGGEYETTRAGLRYRYAIECFDAADRTAIVCGDRTDRATLDFAWSGELVLPRFEGSVEHAGTWEIDGLQSDLAVLDGTGTFDVDASWMTDSARGSYALSYAVRYDAIEIDLVEREVVGGVARWSVDVERKRDGRRSDVEASFTVRAELSFEADGSAVLVLDGSRRYRLDTARGTVVRERG